MKIVKKNTYSKGGKMKKTKKKAINK